MLLSSCAAVLVVVGVVLFATDGPGRGSSAQGNAGTSTTVASSTTTTDPISPDALPSSIPGHIDALGYARYADVYGGVVATDGEAHLDVYLTDLNPSIESTFAALAPTGDISFVSTRNAAVHLTRVEQQINRQVSTLMAEGIQLDGWGPSVETGTDEIYVVNGTASQTQVLDNTFGSSNITVVDFPASKAFRSGRWRPSGGAEPRGYTRPGGDTRLDAAAVQHGGEPAEVRGHPPSRRSPVPPVLRHLGMSGGTRSVTVRQGSGIAQIALHSHDSSSLDHPWGRKPGANSATPIRGHIAQYASGSREGSACVNGGAGRCEGSLLTLVVGGVVLALNRTVSYHPPYVAPSGIHSAFAIPPEPRVRFLCISPFSQLTGVQQQFSGPATSPSAFTGQLAVAPGDPQPKAVSAACGAAPTGSEHIAEALGAGAVLLVGLSFLPRRREPATKRALEPSPV